MTDSLSLCQFKCAKLAAWSAATSSAGQARTCAAVPNVRASTVTTSARFGNWSVSQRGSRAGKTRRNESVTLSTINRRKSGVAGRGSLQVVSSSSEDTFTIQLSTEDARRTILLEQYVYENGTADVYCAGVGVDSEAGKQGLEPGMVSTRSGCKVGHASKTSRVTSARRR
eukprot:5452218-Pyramimonas_sp.AAC.1